MTPPRIPTPTGAQTTTKLHRLHAELGQSPWLDNVTRGYLRDGTLSRMVGDGIRGVTANPTIFAKAIGGSPDYDEQFSWLIGAGYSVDVVEVAAHMRGRGAHRGGQLEGHLARTVATRLLLHDYPPGSRVEHELECSMSDWPPDEDDTSRWRREAREELRAAEVGAAHDEVPDRVAGFHAHLAAEKALKSFLIELGIEVPRIGIHDLVECQTSSTVLSRPSLPAGLDYPAELSWSPGGAITSSSVPARATSAWKSSEAGTQARRTINTHATIMMTVTVLALADVAWRLNAYNAGPVTPVEIAVLSVVIVLLVSVGATFGGTLVYDYGFNVETAGDHPVWHKSETDVLPGAHDGKTGSL